MRIGWLADSAGALRGGAEISSDTLVAAAPPGVEIVMCPPGSIAEDVPEPEDTGFISTSTDGDIWDAVQKIATTDKGEDDGGGRAE